MHDDHRDPKYIETLPKRGYRLIAPVQPVGAAGSETAAPTARPRRRSARYMLLAVAATAIAYAVARVLAPHAPEGDFQSIAVLPFTNLSAEPDQYLADGVTEELTMR